MLFECLAGELPFEGSSRAAYITNLIAGRHRPLHGSVPDAFHAFVARCLAADPDERFSSFATIAAELEAISGQLQPAVSSRTARRTNRVLTPLAAAALLVIIFGYAQMAGEQHSGLDAIVSQEAALTWPTQESGGRVCPSGKIIAFLSDRGGGLRIWLRSRQGTDARAIAGPNRYLKNVTWAPDEDRLAYLFAEQGETYLQVASIWGERVLSPIHLDGHIAEIRLMRWLGDHIYFLVSTDGPSGTQV